MLSYKTETRPAIGLLVALYDIRPGNGAGQFLQPWSPHGAQQRVTAAASKASSQHVNDVNSDDEDERKQILPPVLY